MHMVPVVFAAQLDTYKDTGVVTIQALQTLFANVISIIVALAGVALFVMFIVAGFSFMFSGGDPKKLEQAKGTLTNAIVGLVVIVAAYLILRLVGVISGYTDITKFSVSITDKCAASRNSYSSLITSCLNVPTCDANTGVWSCPP